LGDLLKKIATISYALKTNILPHSQPLINRVDNIKFYV